MQYPVVYKVITIISSLAGKTLIYWHLFKKQKTKNKMSSE